MRRKGEVRLIYVNCWLLHELVLLYLNHFYQHLATHSLLHPLVAHFSVLQIATDT